ncbi:hypothetical protein Tco_0750877 [Tanacetum coccineum]|uniref:Reverse transcriptase zinc-binding domain-containing protein n=1 Tax=Tanacetum coccineum TaxID=301880 RepID=A0ABQ4Z3L3_9ASTR
MQSIMTKFIFSNKLKVRRVEYIDIIVQHHNDRSIDAWYDNWYSEGPLCDYITNRELYDARLSNTCRVAEIIKDENERDEMVWMSGSGKEGKFEIRTLWKDMVSSDLKANCCDYSQEIWKEVQKLLNVQFLYNQIVVEFIRIPANKNIWSVLRMLACGASVYFIWQERNNNRLFKKEKRDGKTILNTIKEAVGMKLISLTLKESRALKEVEAKWNLKLQRTIIS